MNYRLIFLLFLAVVLTACTMQMVDDPDETWYVIKPGDDLEKISQQFSVPRLSIQRENNIYDSADLTPGMKILIPGTRKPSPSANSSWKRTSRASLSMIWPSPGTITSGFGRRHGAMHEGLDISQDNGREIVAAADGIVEFAGNRAGFGKTIIIDHGGNIKTLYGHNAALYVQKGTRVKQGTTISQMGSTGRSSGIHLHFEVRVNGKPQNPLRFLPVR